MVYKTRQVKLNRVFALKMILAGRLASKELVQRFYSEAEAAAGLDHLGIVPVYEVGEHDGQHYFSMGFVDGACLAARVTAGPLAVREAADLVRQIAQAVQYAHDRGVIHTSAMAECRWPICSCRSSTVSASNSTASPTAPAGCRI